MKCYDEDVEAPRGGCGCRECYRAREGSLDPRLMELVSKRFRGLTIQPSSTDIVYRGLVEYLSGRLDYGALHLTLINSLMELADRNFEQWMKLVRMQQNALMFVVGQAADR